MSFQSNASNAYQDIDLHTQIEGASAHELINLLYKGALTKLARARGFMQNGKAIEKGQELGKVVLILTELMECINRTERNQVVDNLESLYTYIREIILTANLQNDIAKLDEARDLLNHLRESWMMIPQEERY
ncbi:MAG: flagellar export chaperone FliS [Granulosicoccus sp.]|nr:flagellar export chaperone FliS [Granulosicoccus sp.]